jgi:hypothetical protein
MDSKRFNHPIIIVFVLIAAFSGLGMRGSRDVSFDNRPSTVSRMSDRDWGTIADWAGAVDRTVLWKIRITDVNGFNGFSVKGHLADSPNARVNLTWLPGEELTDDEWDRLVVGRVVTVSGDVEGVSGDHDVMVGVANILP